MRYMSRSDRQASAQAVQVSTQLKQASMQRLMASEWAGFSGCERNMARTATADMDGLPFSPRRPTEKLASARIGSECLRIPAQCVAGQGYAQGAGALARARRLRQSDAAPQREHSMATNCSQLPPRQSALLAGIAPVISSLSTLRNEERLGELARLAVGGGDGRAAMGAGGEAAVDAVAVGVVGDDENVFFRLRGGGAEQHGKATVARRDRMGSPEAFGPGSVHRGEWAGNVKASLTELRPRVGPLRSRQRRCTQDTLDRQAAREAAWIYQRSDDKPRRGLLVEAARPLTAAGGLDHCPAP